MDIVTECELRICIFISFGFYAQYNTISLIRLRTLKWEDMGETFDALQVVATLPDTELSDRIGGIKTVEKELWLTCT